MKAYHTYSAIDVAFALLKCAKSKGMSLSNLQLQKLTYVCHGLSLSNFDRPMIIEDVQAWKYGPVIPSVYLRFKHAGASPIQDKLEESDLDHESEGVVTAVISKLGHFSGPQLVELTHRTGSPWHQVWSTQKQAIIPDSIIQKHYKKINETGLASCL